MSFWDFFRSANPAPAQPVSEPMGKGEAYWNAKHPEIDQLYNGRPLPNGGTYTEDVRGYIFDVDAQLQSLIGDKGILCSDIDDTAGAAQRAVVNMLTYTPDSSLGRAEYWLYPPETLAMGKGDCEDGAILMASIIVNAIPASDAWRVRVACGLVDDGTGGSGGHAYCTWCRRYDNEWVILDWCYQEDSQHRVNSKPLAKDNKAYQLTWFSFNHQHAWSEAAFMMAGRVKGRVA